MCIPQGQSNIRAAQVAPAPTRAGVSTGADPLSLVNAAKRLATRRLGVFGNLTTTPLGDASYGSSSVAAFGSGKR